MPARIITNDQEIISLYKDGFSSIQIGKYLGISKPTVLKRLRENGITRRKSCFERQTGLDDNVFSSLNADSCYWAGFIAADGCISGGTLSIELSKIDEDHLVKFCNFLKRDCRLWHRERNDYHYCTIGIRSERIISDLNDNFNVVPRKSLTLLPPALPQDMISHFIRGYFDGDGCIGRDGYSLKVHIVSGSQGFLSWVKNSIKSNVDVGDPKIIKSKNSEVFRLHFGGNKQVPKIMNWFYTDCQNNYLERKKKRYQFLLEDL